MMELSGEKGQEPEMKLPSPALVNALKFLSIVYLMTILVLSIVFPLSFFIRGGLGQVNSAYLWIFFIYLSIVGIIFLIYVNIKIHQLKEKPNFNEENKNSTVYTINSPTDHGQKNVNIFNDVDMDREKQITLDHNRGSTGEEKANHDYGHLEHTVKDNKARTLMMARAQPPVQHGGTGVNFFLRLGAIGFALGTMMLDALRITTFFQTPNRMDCYGSLYIIQVALRLVFVMMETHFLFKHHKIILNFRHALMWFGLLHLISSNLVMWSSAVAIETYEGFHAHGGGHGESEGGHGSGEDTMAEEDHSVHKREAEAESQCSANGLDIFGMISPYLYPLVIEFSLIAAAILYKVVTNIGALLNPGYNDWVASEESKSNNDHECAKATTGVVTGLVVLTTMFGVTLAFMLSDDVFLNTHLYLGSDLAIHVVAFIACIFAYLKVSKLTFSGDVENPLDEYLIVICLAGLYFLTGARMVAAFDSLGENHDGDNANTLYIACGFVTFIQASFQTIFIIDGLRREATTAKDQYEKPGRSMISFLLFTNLAMWMVNSFQLKSINESNIMREFYGELAWTIILYLTLPLAVFFRFHSVVCLSDIWIEAYKKRCHALFKISPDLIHSGHEQETNENSNNAANRKSIATVESLPFPNNLQDNKPDSESLYTRL